MIVLILQNNQHNKVWINAGVWQLHILIRRSGVAQWYNSAFCTVPLDLTFRLGCATSVKYNSSYLNKLLFTFYRRHWVPKFISFFILHLFCIHIIWNVSWLFPVQIGGHKVRFFKKWFLIVNFRGYWIKRRIWTALIAGDTITPVTAEIFSS